MIFAPQRGPALKAVAVFSVLPERAPAEMPWIAA